MDLQLFRDKKLQIYLLLRRPLLKSAFEQGLRNHGYQNILFYDDAQSFNLALSNIASPSWIIADINEDDPQELFQLIKGFLEGSHVNQARWSIVADNSQLNLLGAAFELGILSYFNIDQHQNSEQICAIIKSQLNLLDQQLHQSGYREQRLAESYLRSLLISQKNFNSLVHLEESLIAHNPGQPERLLPYALAQNEKHQFDTAEILLDQAEFFDPQLKDQCTQLRDFVLKSRRKIKGREKLPVNGRFGIQTALIVDHDELTSRYVKQMLNDLDIPDIFTASKAKTAAKLIERHGMPDLFVIEKNLNDLDALIFLQQYSKYDLSQSVIILLTSQLKKEEIALIRELNIAQVIMKPFGRDHFYLPLRWTLIQRQKPNDQKMLERSIEVAATQGQWDRLRILSSVYLAAPKILPEYKYLLLARLKFLEGSYQEALSYLEHKTCQVLKDKLSYLQLIAECYLRLGRFKEALQQLYRAQELSPENIHRLCQIANITSHLGEFKKANHAIKLAEELDPNNPQLKYIQGKLALQQDDMMTAENIYADLPDKNHFLEQLNNEAVTLIGIQNYEIAILLYRRIIELINDPKHPIQGILHYNLALAYTRLGQFSQALKTLMDHKTEFPPSIKERAESLKNRLYQALKKNNKPQLNLTQTDVILKNLTFMETHKVGRLVPYHQGLATIVKPSAAQPRCGLFTIFHYQDEYPTSIKEFIKSIEESTNMESRHAS